MWKIWQADVDWSGCLMPHTRFVVLLSGNVLHQNRILEFSIQVMSSQSIALMERAPYLYLSLSLFLCSFPGLFLAGPSAAVGGIVRPNVDVFRNLRPRWSANTNMWAVKGFCFMSMLCFCVVVPCPGARGREGERRVIDMHPLEISSSRTDN